MPAVWTDFTILGVTLAAGLGIGVLHDFWLILVLGQVPKQGRGQTVPVSPHRLWGFWLMAVALAWAVLAMFAAGQVRLFVFAGFAAGAGLYYLTLSPVMRRIIGALRRGLAGAARALLDGLTWLVLLPWRVLCWLGRPVIAVFTLVFGTPARWLLSAIEGTIRMAGRFGQWMWSQRPRRRPPVD